MDEIGVGNYLIMYDPHELNSMARDLYTIYCKAVDGRALNGDPLPDWKEFSNDPAKTKQAHGWLKVAEHALAMR